MARILVTGADGFVGTRLVQHLAANTHEVTAAVRRLDAATPSSSVTYAATGDLERHPDWSPLLDGNRGVIHLAGRAHVMNERLDPLGAARRTNVAPALDLFTACHRAGVERFVFVSSVHVHGTRSGDKPFTEADTEAPRDPYAQSKWEAECGLRTLATQRGAPQLVVVRPTVVCGANAKGNLARLARLVARNLPLPFGSVVAPRNFVGLGNLCDLLERCVTHPAAGGRTYLAADPETLSLPALIRALAAATGVHARLLRVPPSLLLVIGSLVGQRQQLERLTHSLLVDASRARRELGWRNEIPLNAELAAMARGAHPAR